MALDVALRAPSQRQKVCALLIGLFALLYTTSCLVTHGYGLAFFSIPVFVGFVGGLLLPKSWFLLPLCALLAALSLAVVTMSEGIICVLFSLPVLLPLLWLGSFTGSILARHLHTPRAQNGGVGLVVLLAFGSQVAARLTDDPAQHPLHVAEAELPIAAAPAEVFAMLTTRALEVENRWPWFMRVGLPMPDRMRVERAGVGGSVRFDFSQGTAFARITEWQPGRELAYSVDHYAIHDQPFHITRLGRGPDYGFRRERVEDWLTILDTRYTLSPTPSGGTLLRRRILWRRHLAPDLYFGWLEQTVMERGQARLLELIRRQVETKARADASRLAVSGSFGESRKNVAAVSNWPRPERQGAFSR